MTDIILPGFEPISRIIELAADRAGLHPEKAADLVWQAIETSDVRLFERGRITWWKDSDAADAARRARAAWRQAQPRGRYDPHARRWRSDGSPDRAPPPPSGRALFTGTVHLGDLERGLARLQIVVSLSPAPEPSAASVPQRRRGRPPLAPWDDLIDDLIRHMIEHGRLRRREAIDWALDWCMRWGHAVDAPTTVEPYVEQALARFEASLDRTFPVKVRATGN
jgi:hypothetical protein